MTRRTGRILALVATFFAAPRAEGDEVRDFFNVVAPEGADPWVWKQPDGRYYLVATTGRDITLRRSWTLSGLGAGERKVVWRPPAAGPLSQNLWAPELHRLQGKWYVYLAADDGVNARHRMYVLENPAADPFEGKFTVKGKLFDPTADRWAIDGTVFQVGRSLYFVWSGWEGDKDVRQDLYIAPMRDPWTLAGRRVRIATPSLPWETRGAPPAVAEGPEVLVRGSKIQIVYSASGSWTDFYCLGLLTARANADLLSPASWVKHDQPIFETGNGVIAPGHASFTTSPDGREDWLVYHSAQYPGARWSRQIRAQQFRWTADDAPDLGTPATPKTPLPLPSGELPHQRYLAAENESTRTPDEAAVFVVTVRDPGPYALSIRYQNDDPAKAESSQVLTINTGPPQTLHYVYTGPDRRSNALARMTLKAGANRLQFRKAAGLVAIESLDVINDRKNP